MRVKVTSLPVSQLQLDEKRVDNVCNRCDEESEARPGTLTERKFHKFASELVFDSKTTLALLEVV